MNKLLNAKLVWDGGDEIAIPEDMGKPAETQMQGTARERLIELAGRVCYDSLGKGRSSSDYHKHIQEVGHLSVLEHAYATVEIQDDVNPIIFLNRPDVWVLPSNFGKVCRVTFNPRSVLEWNSWNVDIPPALGHSTLMSDLLRYHASKLYPQIVAPVKRDVWFENYYNAVSVVAIPERDEEKWISMFMAGSRGFSHELVRHGNFTAISQRSTRFVSEDESDWVDHPLVLKYCEALIKEKGIGDFMDSLGSLKTAARKVYSDVVERLQGWITKQGVDKLTARKQARGAARGYLGNALYTELIFSANVAQWKRMLRMRCSASADAEIREVFVQALGALKSSRYSYDFARFELAPSPDGLGQIAVEK